MGNSLGRVPWGRSDTGATTGWTEGKPWEIAWGDFRWERVIRKRREGGRKGNRGNRFGRAPWRRSDGGETVGNSLAIGNSLGRAPFGGSEMEVTTRVDGGETVGNSLGRAP